MSKIGPTFTSELAADGVSLDGLAWDPIAGAITAWTSPDQLAAAQAVLAKHDPASVDLPAYAAAARYARETGGISVNGAPIATDRQSQAMITGAWSAAQMNPNISVQWKGATGFVALDANQIQAIASAVVGHVQACFAAEAQVDQDITSGKTTTTAQIDAAFAAVTA